MDKTLVKGLMLIEALARGGRARGVTDLAAELGLTKSNVHRLLATLQAQGYVRQVEAGARYELTTRIWELGSRVIGQVDLVPAARPAMRRLSELTSETVHLSILDGTDVVYVAKIEGAHHIRAHTSVGARAPAFTVATGKAMLAHMPDDYLAAFAPHLRPYTASTRITLDALRGDLRRIRQDGYALVPHGEWREGIAACAAAILGGPGDLAGAIGISGPDSRISETVLQQVAPAVTEAARTVSRALGYVGPNAFSGSRPIATP